MQYLWLHNNSLSGILPPQWGALSSTLYCYVNGNCLNTSNATTWWLRSAYRNIGLQRTTGCVAIVAHGASRGASLSISNTRSESVTGSQSMVFSTSSSMSATYSLPSGSYLSVSASSKKLHFFSLTQSAPTTAVTLSETRSSSTTNTRVVTASQSDKQFTSTSLSLTTQWTPSLFVSSSRTSTAALLSMSGTPWALGRSVSASRSHSWWGMTGTHAVSKGTRTGSHSSDTTATACVATGVGLLSLADNATMLFSSPSPVLGASVRFDDLQEALRPGEAVVLIVGGAGLVGAWTFASLAIGSTGVLIAESSSGEGVARASFALPAGGWPGLQPQRPYALQHVDIAAVIVCGREARNVSVLVEVQPRAVPVVDAVAVVVQSSQGAAVASGGADALAVGRMATTVVVLPCEDFLSGAAGVGYGIGVVALTDKYHPAVDTIAGNLVFVLCLVVAALLFSVCLHTWVRHSLSVGTVMRDVLRLPSSLLPVVAATLPTSVMAVVALLRDRPAGSALAYALAFVGVVFWGGCLALVCVALVRCRRLLVARPRAVLSRTPAASCAERLVRAVSTASVEWSLSVDVVEDEPSTTAAFPAHGEQCIALVEGLRVAWFTPADLGASLLMAVVSALPLSESRALCAAVASINAIVSAAMLAVVTVLRPFSTAIGSAHSVVMAVATTVNAACVLACVALGPGGSVATVALLSAAIQYSTAAAATLALVKAAVDIVTFAVLLWRRLEATVALATKRASENATLMPSMECASGDDEELAHEDDDSTLLDFLSDLRVDDASQGPSLLDEILSPGDHAATTDLMMAYGTQQSDFVEGSDCCVEGSAVAVDLGSAHATSI